MKHVHELCQRTMIQIERVVPATEHTMIIHSIWHLPTQMDNWGPSRSCWAFSNERLCGTLKRMVQNHKDIEAHLMEIARSIMTLPIEDEQDVDQMVDEYRFISTLVFKKKVDIQLQLVILNYICYYDKQQNHFHKLN